MGEGPYLTDPLIWALMPGDTGWIILSWPRNGRLVHVQAVPWYGYGNIEQTSVQVILNYDGSWAYVINFKNVGPVPTNVAIYYYYLQ